MSKRCITTNSTIEELAAKLQGETIESVKGLVELWQDKNNKDWDTYPTASELNKFRAELRKGSHLGWARTASNSYEVSTRGDKRFSALVAKFAKGTIIDGVDVGGRTIEDVYQAGTIPSNVIFSKEWVDTNKLNTQYQITPEQKQKAQQLYSQYLEQNPNGSVEQFKSWVNRNNINKPLFSLSTNNIKLGVPELFESNPELANAVYSAMGFGQELSTTKKLSIEELDKIIYDNNLRPELFPNLKSLHSNRARLKGFNVAPDKAAIYFLKNILIEANRNQSEIKTDIEDIQDLIERAIISIEKGNYGEATQLGEQALSKLHDDVSRFIINQIKENLITYPIATINQITPQQKQQAQQKFQEYVNSTGKQDIEGFKEFVRGKQSITPRKGISELFSENPQLASIGTQEQYERYLSTIFKTSKVKDIVYHGTNVKFEKFNTKNTYFVRDLEEYSADSFTPINKKYLIAAVLNIKSPAFMGKGKIITKYHSSDNQKLVEDTRDIITQEEYNKLKSINNKYRQTLDDKYRKEFGEFISKINYTTRMNRMHPFLIKGDKKYYKETDGVILNKDTTTSFEFNWDYTKQGKNVDLFDYVKVPNINQKGEADSWYVVFEPEQIHILGSKQDIEQFKSWVDSNLANQIYEALGFGQDRNYYEGNITPEPNTIFVFGSNPEGRHGAGAAKIAREQFGAIYRQGEGLQGNAYALPTKRIKSITPTKTGQMTFSYGTNKRSDIKSNTTLEAIINGERTATTRYSTDGHIDYWKDLKVGDIVAFTSADRKTTVYVKITKPLTQLNSSTNAEEWSKKEGWSVEYYNSKVKPKVEKGQAYQMEYEFFDANGERTITPLQIIENIKKLYETARQNPDKQFKIAYKNTDKASLNGYTGLEMIDMFLKAGSIPSNIYFSKEWIDTGKFNLSREELEDFSYTEGYLPLWQEWARQNPELMNELRAKSAGKTLTDQFANTRVSQARALSEILNETSSQEAIEMLDKALSSSFETPKISTIEEQAKVDLDFDPRTRRDRVSLIARFFSNEVDTALQEHNEALNERIADAEKEGDVLAVNELKEELATLDRFKIIKLYTPAGLFSRVRDYFNNYILDSEENRIQSELNTINSMKGSERYSDEQKYEAAKKKALYKTNAYQKVVDNFKPLAEEASTILIATEGIRIDPNYDAPKEANLSDDTPEGDSELDVQTDDFVKEESFKDGWMTNYREVSSHESLSQEVRKVIREIPRLDYRGKYDKDDLGNLRFLDADYVHATLIDKLRDMITSDDMLPLLETLGNTKPWTKQIVKKLQAKLKLFSQFYQDFRKDFVLYWIQKKKLQADGTFKMETIAINKPEGVYYLLDEWRDNYENGNLLDDDSIYDKNGDLNLENAENGLKWTEALNNRFTNLSTEQRLELLQDEKVWKTLNKLLNMIGINTNQGVLLDALTNIKQYEGGTATDPIMLLLPQLNIIFSGVKKGEVKSETLEDRTEKRGDLINTFGSAYNSIAMMLAEVTEDAIESSVREYDKLYYGHVMPNYLGKLIKQLKNVMGNEARFKEFIENEFKQYEWFYKDGRWRNDWIEQLVNNPEMRRGLSHKVLLNSDKVAYQNWDDLDYTLVLLTEYFGDPDNSKSDVQWANYYVPILSDSPSAEFIRFRKYDNHSIIGEDGEYMKYDDIILDRMVDLVNQEVDRIALVNQRDIEYQKGNPNIAPIANYDIVRGKDGTIKSIGGAEFKFLIALNDVKYDNGETFLDRFQRIQNEGTGAELREFIRESVREALDNEFEQTYKEWAKAGLLEELPNGKYKYLGVMGVNAGQSSYNRNTATSLNNAKKALEGMWTTEMDILLRDYNNNNPVDDRRATTLFESIKDLLREKMVRGEITAKEMDSINRNLVIRNNAKAKLREYFWNSKFATSQIIELTTTDLAFYKNIEDFQKRYKEVHAPALRLNTNSKYGRKEERTIYLKDDEIVSSVLDDIATVLDERVKKGEMLKRDRDLILNKFREVNVADAQAYRSLSSYRAILDMSGQWTDDMQRAFDNFQNGKWDMADFNIIWQTKKPYVYTQVNNDSGVEGHTGIKTPVQHKNSEFLLLAMHELVAGPLGRSGKLKAINKFMEDNQIDVVQFESTTKVGKQGVIDLNDVNTEADVIQRLKETTGIEFGNENPNVVHKVSYEDYGIQTATPEHAIDAIQLIGTQIRKLITADISPDVKIDVNGREMSKQEWLDMYNAINTENIIQAFADVNEIFKDPKQVEKILLEELRGNQRYGIDMIRACTLNEKGQFNIPLFDPVQSQRVQTLLNSIIKSRITKQKIRGGALIQVSNYGLTDELKIVFEGEGENKRIKYLEVYMPAYSKKFYEPLMKPGTHELDVTKLPDNLRKLIGYRVPTEDKYSMAPLYIKGFLPQQNGSSIMLPSEITTLSGSDFDVDKLYIMLPEFKITPKYNRRQFVDDLVAQLTQGKAVSPEVLKEYRQSVDRAIDEGRKAPKGSQEYNIWQTYKANREKYRVSQEDKIEKIEYDFSKSPQENGLEARNNLLIDMMWGVLTNADTASKILNPGGFDYQKKSARMINILQSSRESELRKELNIPENQSTLSKLQSMDLRQLDKLAEKFKKKLDPLNPRTQVKLHQQNMTGAALIGIYANHNANHALMQHTELGLDTENGSFLLNGKRLTSLHGLMNDNKEYISRNNAGFLAASVDNVIDPVLASLNQNTFTADASMLLSRLGYDPIEIGLIMSQPIVMDITNAYFRESREGKGKDTIIDEVIENYKKRAAMMEDVTYDNYKSNKFMADELADNIILQKEVEELGDRTQTSDYRKVEFYKKQVAVGYLFKRMMGTADALGQLVQATRADTQGGAAGPTIADTQIKIQKVNDFITNVVLNEKSPLTGADVIMPFSMKGMDIDQIREKLLSSPLPYLQAFFSLGIDQTQEMLSKYFPQFTKPFDKVVNVLRSMTKTGRLNVKTMNSIYNDVLAYIMSKTDFFGAEPDWRSVDENGNPTKMITSADKRRDFINNFPDYFNRTLSEHPEIAELEFVKRLRVIRANQNNPVDTVVFKNVGQLSPTLRERYMRDWQSLLYMGPEAQALALNLFRYSYYRNGFAFGPSTFIHLAPTAVRQSVPEYIDTLRGLLESEDDYSPFSDQYIYNHLDNRQLVPEVPTEASTSFTNEQGDALDMVKITIDTESNSSDKKIIRKREGIGEETTYDFFNYIARRYKGGTIYYRLTQADNVQPNVAVYERIDPLGFKNSFIEYEYGKDVTEMKSVIDKNDRDYTPNVNQDITAYQEANVDYDSMPEYLNYDFSSLTQDIASEAFSQVYGAPLEVNEGKADDINSISPNTEYEDANNDKICGANTLYEL